jgi:hypothetical protein
MFRCSVLVASLDTKRECTYFSLAEKEDPPPLWINFFMKN